MHKTTKKTNPKTYIIINNQCQNVYKNISTIFALTWLILSEDKLIGGGIQICFITCLERVGNLSLCKRKKDLIMSYQVTNSLTMINASRISKGKSPGQKFISCLNKSFLPCYTAVPFQHLYSRMKSTKLQILRFD